ncbi:hypothetical protein R3W88_025350 [Solanum pinnatisectum]|uniref:Uncharacterized protein n=1 Tax=Solanum pinnatisectum TaxID=50273 RepID=A0AAV9M4K9_9SOLN|nr:hypothetical protein R3W88_025350 [Solanum pinnatisectum]
MWLPCGCGRDEKKLKHEDETGSDLNAEDGESDGEPEYDSDDWRTWPDRDVFIQVLSTARRERWKERNVTKILKLNAGCLRDFAY